MHYFSRGKILITGEYLVLFGAKALAVPSRLGQHLDVKESKGEGNITIHSLLNDSTWFSCRFDLPDFKVSQTSESMVSDFVKELLLAASDMKPGYFGGDRNIVLRSELEFDTRWGLGSSSSLISNLASWLDIDPYQLFWRLSPGSGYDIACARSSHPIYYRLEKDKALVERADFNPAFSENIYFVYLGTKQDSQDIVRDFRKRFSPDEVLIARISRIAELLTDATSLEDFEALLTEHEAMMSRFLGIPTVKESRFPGFHGAIKSLGAWGGDMVLVTWKGEEEELRKYFKARGLNLIFRYADLV